MNWIETTVGCCECGNEHSVQNCGEFLTCLRTCWLLPKHSAAWRCITTTVQSVSRQKAIPCRTESTAFLPVTGSATLFLHSTFRSPIRSVPSVNSPLCSFSQQSALFVQSTFRSPVRSVPTVNSPLCSFSQHSALQSALFLQSTFRSPVLSVPSVNIPLCSFSQQSALFLQSTFRSPVRSVPSVNIPLSSPLCTYSQHSALQSALFLQATVRSVTSHQTIDTLNVTFLQTSTFLSTKAVQLLHRPFTATASGRPQSLHVWTVVQQQQYQLSAASSPQFYITFAMFMFFWCQ